MRTEKDFLGEVSIDDGALYGIHSIRARSNFPHSTPFPKSWYRAIGLVKKSCYETYQKYTREMGKKYPETESSFISSKTVDALTQAAAEVQTGAHFKDFIVPGVCGGAGTSFNMNVNEIIANRALQLLDSTPGNYLEIDPIEQANIYQSTNDVIPSALKIAVMTLLIDLEKSVDLIRQSFEGLEREYRDTLRIAYTQMQEAVPSSYGKLFSTYQEALSRDWWRISKCMERIKVINIGGSAIGTGITVPKYFIFEVIENLRHETQLPLSRGDNLQDTTCNLDPFVEVHAILKSLAVNLEKAANDIRALSADTFHESDMTIPARQVGSSIMPGKVNPVIAEYVISVSHEVYANDAKLTALCGMGYLDLNAYIPTIGTAIISTIEQLTASCDTFRTNLLEGLTIDKNRSAERLLRSPSIATALVPYIGYNKASAIAHLIKNDHITIHEAVEKTNYLPTESLDDILNPSKLLQLGFVYSDIKKAHEQ
ncbi:MAG: lyase family protein [Fibrobacterales bacterium]